jgi:hypothetical protein
METRLSMSATRTSRIRSWRAKLDSVSRSVRRRAERRSAVWPASRASWRPITRSSDSRPLRSAISTRSRPGTSTSDAAKSRSLLRRERDAPSLARALLRCPSMPRSERGVRAVESLRAGLFALSCVLSVGSIAHAQHGIPVVPADEPVFSISSPLGSIDYVAARGLRLGRSGLTIGGFTTLEIDKEEGRSGGLELNGPNFLLLWEPADFLRAFAELELEDVFAVDFGTGDVESDPGLTVERVYGDLTRSDALNFRFGKFQTPVGIWNLVPAEPFTWTATEPVLVETAFDEHTTGGAFFGSLYPSSTSGSLDYWLYGQFLNPLDPSDTPLPADRSAGGRLRYAGTLESWAVGTSFLAAERGGDWSFLGGLDAFWRIGRLELQSEFAIVRGDLPGRDLWGVYVQGVYGLGGSSRALRGLHLVGRYEHFDPWDAPGEEVDLFDAGLAWIPANFLVIKVGYRFADRQTELVRRGLFTSVSILF